MESPLVAPSSVHPRFAHSASLIQHGSSLQASSRLATHLDVHRQVVLPRQGAIKQQLQRFIKHRVGAMAERHLQRGCRRSGARDAGHERWGAPHQAEGPHISGGGDAAALPRPQL